MQNKNKNCSPTSRDYNKKTAIGQIWSCNYSIRLKPNYTTKKSTKFFYLVILKSDESNETWWDENFIYNYNEPESLFQTETSDKGSLRTQDRPSHICCRALIKRKDEGDRFHNHLCKIYAFAGGKVLQPFCVRYDNNLHCTEAAGCTVLYKAMGVFSRCLKSASQEIIQD